jgi:hypothetical protein
MLVTATFLVSIGACGSKQIQPTEADIKEKTSNLIAMWQNGDYKAVEEQCVETPPDSGEWRMARDNWQKWLRSPDSEFAPTEMGRFDTSEKREIFIILHPVEGNFDPDDAVYVVSASDYDTVVNFWVFAENKWQCTFPPFSFNDNQGPEEVRIFAR